MRSFLPAATLAVAALLMSGCDKMQSTAVTGSAAPHFAAVDRSRLRSEKTEQFIYVPTRQVPGDRRLIASQFRTLVETAPGGTVVHVIETPGHRPLACIVLPGGPPNTRQRNRDFREAVAGLKKFFNSDGPPDGSDQLHLPLVPSTVANLRRTTYPCRIILCGAPTYDEPDDPTFTTEKGMVPSDGLLFALHSPFSERPDLPDATLISWLIPNMTWGTDRDQRRELERFWKLFFQIRHGNVIRLTPDPALAFSFTLPHLNNQIVAVDEIPAMRHPKVETELENKEAPVPVIVPVQIPNVSFKKPGSIAHRIEMNGGNVEALVGESIVLQVVYDGSGSMASKIQENNLTILSLSESLPPLVKSLEIGIEVHSSIGTRRFPVTQIKEQESDGGASLQNLRDFLSSIDASGSDGVMREMLGSGMTHLASVGVGKRQFLMVVADCVCGVTPSDSDAQFAGMIPLTRQWATENKTDRRLISMFSGDKDEHEKFFRDIGAINANSCFSRSPDDLIEAVISSALPPGTLQNR
ncbi:hypothetical protein [Novipirellula sp.]|uniref:hypothetical protein n=1 Tax=Novipirellula sp. TaxID=2795430 RepID=UPI003561B406